MPSACSFPPRTCGIRLLGVSTRIWMSFAIGGLHRRRRALERDVHHVDPGGLLEELRGEVRCGADAGGAEIELARVGLRVGDQLLHVLRRARCCSPS